MFTSKRPPSKKTIQPLSDALMLVDELNRLGAVDTQHHHKNAKVVSQHTLHMAITDARAAFIAYLEEEQHNQDAAAVVAAEQLVREQSDRVTVALLDLNKVLNEHSEMTQRASIAKGKRAQLEFLWLTAGAFVLAMLISAWVSRIIRERLRPLNEGARILSEGTLTHRIPVGVHDELGELARAFNRMAKRLERKESALEAQVAALNQANTEARMSNAHLDCLIDSIPDALLVVDAEQRIVRSNPAAQVLVGNNDAGLAGTTLLSLLSLDLRAMQNNSDDAVIAMEAQLLTKQGEHVPVNVSSAEIRTPDGHSDGAIIIAQDITIAKQAERRRTMKYTITRLLAGADTLHEVMPDILDTLGGSLDYACGSYWRWDATQDLLLHDQAWGGDTDARSAFLACQSSNDPTSTGGLIRRTWNTGEFAWIDDVSIQADFQRAPFAHNAKLRGGLAIPIWDGTTTFGVLELFSLSSDAPDAETLQDCQSICAQIGQFCRRKEAEVALHEKTDRLEQSNRELDQFAYVTSHDLKAPLRAIANLATWIEEDLGEHLKDEISDNMLLLKGRVHRMEALIQGILDYSRIGRESVRSESVDVSALLVDVVDSLPVPAQFQINVDDGMPVLNASKVRLTQVFANLIGNAIKYHDRPDGCVNMTVTNGGDWYEFSVEDDGPGIPDEYHEKVFGIFQTLEARDKIESTGIGLTLVKKIIEEQGGSISIAPASGRGARFHFTWPAERQAA
jgi:PAS domain S-box-containing protein